MNTLSCYHATTTWSTGWMIKHIQRDKDIFSSVVGPHSRGEPYLETASSNNKSSTVSARLLVPHLRKTGMSVSTLGNFNENIIIPKHGFHLMVF